MKNPTGIEPKVEQSRRANFNRNAKTVETNKPPIEFKCRPQTTIKRTLKDEDLGSLLAFKVQRPCRGSPAHRSRTPSPSPDELRLQFNEM
jgi:hypothetical protein